MSEYFLVNGRKFVLEPNPLPIPIPEPVEGWRVKQGDGQIPIRVVHDNPSRTLGELQLKQTNEMYVPRRWYKRDDGQWRVDQYSKISFWPERLSALWEWYFFSGMTQRQKDKFNTHATGWRDSHATPDELNIYNFLLCGGSLLKKIGTWREWTLFATQNTDEPPDLHASYSNTPHKWFKQYLVGHDRDKNTYWVVDKGEIGGLGDLYIPTACPTGIAAILSNEVVEIPKLPYTTSINGYPVTFVEYCFSGSNTYGLSTNGSWYVIEEMPVLGSLENRAIGGSWLDRRVYVDNWPVPAPAAVIGWQAEYSLLSLIWGWLKSLILG